MATVIATYIGGINDTMEEAADTIAKLHGAELVGSGCFIGDNAPRDLEYEVGDDNTESMIADLEAAGFKAHQQEEDD